jgi:hypothetical protein
MAQTVLIDPKCRQLQATRAEQLTLILSNLTKSVSRPEKAGVGGSIPSLATIFKHLQAHRFEFGCIWLHFYHTLLHCDCLSY